MKKSFFKKQGILFSFVFFITNVIYAQGAEIKGLVVDDLDSLLFGNVLMLDVKDTSLIRGVYLEDGFFSIKEVSQNEVFIKIRSRGYYDTLLLITNIQEKQVVDLGQILLKRPVNMIDGVEVTAKVPLFEPNMDGSVQVNVQKTMLSSSTSLIEVLSKTPNVVVSESGINVIGKGEALLFLNNRRITMDQLAAISVGDVKDIEIITNPSARYDASGMAVINIRTIVNNKEGWKGTVIQNTTMAKYFLSNTQLSLNYRKGKWSVLIDYGLNLGADWRTTSTNTFTEDASGTYRSISDSEFKEGYNNLSNYSLGFAYDFNPKNKLSIEYNGYYNSYDIEQSTTNQIIVPNQTADLTIQVDNNEDLKNVNSSLSLNYFHDIDSLGSSLFVGAQYASFTNDSYSALDEVFIENGNTALETMKRNVGNSLIDLFSTRLDYEKKFSSTVSLELGAKYANSNNDGSVDFSIEDTPGNFINVPAFTNGFEYNEDVIAGYAQFGQQLKKDINYSFGLRSEYTAANGYSKVLKQDIIDTTYINFFPNAQIGKSFGKKWTVNLSYSSRINRPLYQSLDPFVWYKDSLTSTQGNPELQPAKTHALETTVGFKGYTFKVGYAKTDGAFRNIFLQGDNGVNSVVQKLFNIERLDSYYASLAIPFNVKRFWRSYNTVSLTYDKINDSRPEFMETSSIPQLYFYSYNRFRWAKVVDFELIGLYLGEYKEGINHIQPTGYVTVGVSRSFFDNSLLCRLVVNDIFDNFRRIGSAQVGIISANYRQNVNNRYIRLSLTYNFGKLKKVNYSNDSVGSEEQDRIQK